MAKYYLIQRGRRFISAVLILLFVLILPVKDAEHVHADNGRNVTQNWAAAAVFYDTAAAETETFHMTEQEFLECKTDLESRLVFAYSTYYNKLSGEAQELLEEAQKSWIDCYYSYISALEQRWLEPVKIYFGAGGKERRTNVYREIILLMLTNRITDLEEWNAGRFADVEPDLLSQKQDELEDGKRQLQVDMGLCLYVIQEEYRAEIKAAHRKFFTFLESNEKFISIVTNDNQTMNTAEGLLQVQRMSYMTGVHYQGCRFFRREREE